jgi:hypothetical protein
VSDQSKDLRCRMGKHHYVGVMDDNPEMRGQGHLECTRCGHVKDINSIRTCPSADRPDWVRPAGSAAADPRHDHAPTQRWSTSADVRPPDRRGYPGPRSKKGPSAGRSAVSRARSRAVATLSTESPSWASSTP